MTCNECHALMKKDPLDCTRAERSAVRQHYRGCAACQAAIFGPPTSLAQAVVDTLADGIPAAEVARQLEQVRSDQTTNDPEVP